MPSVLIIVKPPWPPTIHGWRHLHLFELLSGTLVPRLSANSGCISLSLGGDQASPSVDEALWSSEPCSDFWDIHAWWDDRRRWAALTRSSCQSLEWSWAVFCISLGWWTSFIIKTCTSNIIPRSSDPPEAVAILSSDREEVSHLRRNQWLPPSSSGYDSIPRRTTSFYGAQNTPPSLIERVIPIDLITPEVIDLTTPPEATIPVASGLPMRLPHPATPIDPRKIVFLNNIELIKTEIQASFLRPDSWLERDIRKELVRKMNRYFAKVAALD